MRFKRGVRERRQLTKADLSRKVEDLERTTNWFKVRTDDLGNWVPTTLTQHLGCFVHDLESRFGKRDQSFTILGVELMDSKNHPNPQTFFYPTDPEQKHVAVQLGRDDNPWVLWQLAHECVHLLDPCRQGEVSVLEEGLASWYQDLKVPECHRTDTDRRYEEVKVLVAPLMNKYPDAILDIRAEGVRICDISIEQLENHCPEIAYPSRLVAKYQK